MRDFDAVVFDMDGVIFDSERAGYLCWEEVARRSGCEEIMTLYHQVIGCSYARIKALVEAKLGKDFPFDRFREEVFILYHERYGGGKMPLKPGAMEILLFLRENGKKTALASSSELRTVKPLLEAAGLYELFDVIVTGEMAARSKPAPDIFLLACEKLGTRPERSFAVEDSHNGIRAAHAGRLRPVMVPDMLPADDEMRELAETVEPDLPSVMQYLTGKDDPE